MRYPNIIPQRKPDFSNTYSGVETLALTEKIAEGIVSILDSTIEEILQEAEETQKPPKNKLPKHIFKILEPFFERYTTHTKDNIIKIFTEEEILAAPRKQKPIMRKQNEKGGKKIHINKTYTAYLDVLAHVKENFLITDRDRIIHTLGFSYIWNNLSPELFDEYFAMYQANFKGAKQMYEYMENYIQSTIAPYLRSMIKEGITISNSVVFQDLLKKLYVDVCFPNKEHSYVVFPSYVKASLFRSISAIRAATNKTSESTVLYKHINGILAEIHGNYMMNSLGQASNNMIQAHQIDLDQDVSEDLNVKKSTDAVYVVTAPDQTRYIYCIDFKNHDTSDQIVFGDQNIVQLYASDGIYAEKSVHDDDGAYIGQRATRLYKMLEGIHDVLGFDKKTPVRVLAIKAGLTDNDHFTPLQLEKKTQAFFEEFMQNQFPNYIHPEQ